MLFGSRKAGPENQRMIFGKKVTMPGKSMSNPIAIMSQIIKGIAALYTSDMVVSFGATPFITKQIIPNGGVVNAISILMSIKMPNHTSSNPKARITGI